MAGGCSGNDGKHKSKAMKIFDVFTLSKNESVLRITKSKTHLLSRFIFSCFLLIGVSVIFFSFSPTYLIEKNQLLLGLYLIPIFTLPIVIKSIRPLINRWTLEFDLKTESILLNNKVLSDFKTIERLELKYEVSRNENTHFLLLEVQNQNPILLMQNDKRAILENYGMRISKFISIDFWYKDPRRSEMLWNKQKSKPNEVDYLDKKHLIR